jgi:site-specific recombinase XerD
VTPAAVGAVSGQPARLEPAQRARLSARLLAAVRPEFRVEVLIPAPDDLILGTPPCRVDGCPHRQRHRGLCHAHHQRWKRQGRPDLEEFVAAADPTVIGRRSATPCLVGWCRFGAARRGLCVRHHEHWERAGKPERASWATGPPEPPGWERDRPACRLPFCTLWAHSHQPFCIAHLSRWHRAGRPQVEEFIGSCTTRGEVRYDLRPLPGPGLRLELQFALQCRHDDRRARLTPQIVAPLLRRIAASGVTSLLDWPLERWEHQFPSLNRSDVNRQLGFLRYARARLAELYQGSGWEAEFPLDVWDLRRLGLRPPSTTEGTARLRFDRIPQPWLRQLAKRWMRSRLGSGIGNAQVAADLLALTRFAHFLAIATSTSAPSMAAVTRQVLERYLAQLAASTLSVGRRNADIGALNRFLQAIRQRRWDGRLPADAVLYPEDFTKAEPGGRLPRALAEQVMAQVEDPANLDRWPDPAGRLLTTVLIRCGLRVGDATRLPSDCLIRAADGAPYLRYVNHKLQREALVPIDDDLERQLREQQRRVLARWAAGAPVLFPQPTRNPDGHKPLSTTVYRQQLRRWLASCEVRDEHGQPVHLTPHQWRHTFATRLINRDVPQEVVRVLLDHDSHQMTAHYARLHDQTIRQHWERARKVNIGGEEVVLDPEGPLAEAAWAKQRLGRVTQALPNGFCGLPLQQSCPHANACLTCPMFVTTPAFLPQHRHQRQQLLQLVSAAEARGQLRVVEMNRQVLSNLDRIIATLEPDDADEGEGVADAG